MKLRDRISKSLDYLYVQQSFIFKTVKQKRREKIVEKLSQINFIHKSDLRIPQIIKLIYV